MRGLMHVLRYMLDAPPRKVVAVLLVQVLVSVLIIFLARLLVLR